MEAWNSCIIALSLNTAYVWSILADPGFPVCFILYVMVCTGVSVYKNEVFIKNEKDREKERGLPSWLRDSYFPQWCQHRVFICKLGDGYCILGKVEL